MEAKAFMNDNVLLWNVKMVAAKLGCSLMHVRRLSETGQMPAAVRVGTLVRWRRVEIEEWIAGGCKRQGEATCPPK